MVEQGEAPKLSRAQQLLARAVSGAALFADDGEPPWLVEGLEIVSGRPCVLAAGAGAGKTIFTQSLVLHVALGRSLWGRFAVRQCRVLHLDQDQGIRPTRRRYRRLAAAMGVDAAELGDSLVVLAQPDLFLTEPGVEATLTELVAGFGLVVLDAWRGFAAGTEENAPEQGDYMRILSRVSEKTGTAFLVLWHSGKEGADDGPNKSPMRGSSAAEAASGVVIKLRGPKEGVKTVSFYKHSQEWSGDVTEVFGVRYTGQGKGSPLLVEYVPIGAQDAASAEQDAEARAVQREQKRERRKEERALSAQAQCENAILAKLAVQAGPVTSMAALRAMGSGSSTVRQNAAHNLLTGGQIVKVDGVFKLASEVTRG